jgi:hypothetical protein
VPVASYPVHPEQNPRQTAFEGIRIREDTAYSDARGNEKPGIRKRTEKALRELRQVLLKTLGADETVFYVARAQVLPSKLEEFFLGWLAYSTQGGLLIFTNQRLLYFVTDRAGRWKKSLRAAQWGDIEKAQAKRSLFHHTLFIKYRNGTSETFWRLRGGDARKIKVLLAALLPVGAGETSPALGMVHLCPNCLAPLREGVYQCEKCGARFKDEKTMVRRARLFPWLAYSYVGHPGLAVLDFFVEAWLLLEIAVRLIIAARLMLLPHPLQASAMLAGVWVGIVLLLAVWAFKRWLMLRQCRRFVREFIPSSS